MKQEVKDAIQTMKMMETTVNYVLEDMTSHKRIAWMLYRLFEGLDFRLMDQTTIEGTINGHQFCVIKNRKIEFAQLEISVEHVQNRLYIISQLNDKGEYATADELRRELVRDFIEFVAEKGNDKCSEVAKALMQ